MVVVSGCGNVLVRLIPAVHRPESPWQVCDMQKRLGRRWLRLMVLASRPVALPLDKRNAAAAADSPPTPLTPTPLLLSRFVLA